ncbi:unnamed protein product [Macrosiphum euphorbiae]|uniref:Endonuclease/exonuclease/phosphatase domain-containing protein n=1 Tax=Macrosiphum euphorbiae TaxID=13131 RepID=A0AAV0XEM5_9HEMI|nr:unnamed protein product [Macrosiphum euphorbiae]
MQKNGIKNKIDELKILLNKEKIDIALISETKLKPTIILKITNYFIYRSDNTLRPGTAANGGTAVIIHRRIVHRQVHQKTSLNSTSVEISLGSDSIQISAVYKRPQSPLAVSDLNLLTSSCDWFIIAGDLNAKHPSWNSNSVNPAGRVLYRHAQNSDYVVTAPSSPTHFPNNPVHRPDILDVALHKLPLHLVEVFNLNELSSDHNPILLVISDPPCDRRTATYKS